MQNNWTEIKCDYVDDDAICYIDAWKEGVEQGKTIAWVDKLSGRVIYGCPEARTNHQVQDIIRNVSEQAKKSHPYSLEHLEKLLKKIVNLESEEIGTGPDVRQKLQSMGFSDEEMIFFGFPPFME